MATRTVATGVIGAKAGFWIRVGAYLIDAIIVIVAGSILNSILGITPTPENVTGQVISLVYFIVLWSSIGGGQTVGMRILNLKVVKTDGAELTLVQGLIRYVGLIIAVIPLAIGVIWVAFDAERQGWHDKIAGTYVVRTT